MQKIICDNRYVPEMIETHHATIKTISPMSKDKGYAEGLIYFEDGSVMEIELYPAFSTIYRIKRFLNKLIGK